MLEQSSLLLPNDVISHILVRGSFVVQMYWIGWFETPVVGLTILTKDVRSE